VLSPEIQHLNQNKPSGLSTSKETGHQINMTVPPKWVLL